LGNNKHFNSDEVFYLKDRRGDSVIRISLVHKYLAGWDSIKETVPSEINCGLIARILFSGWIGS
jgi:hypothetical protein